MDGTRLHKSILRGNSHIKMTNVLIRKKKKEKKKLYQAFEVTIHFAGSGLLENVCP